MCPAQDERQANIRGPGMTSIIGGYDTGLFDSSLFLLNRDDKSAGGTAGHGEELYVNIANGNLVVMHKDAYLPSQGEDYYLARTYNSRGTWGGTDGPSWSNNSAVLELSQITNNKITLVNADTSRFVFAYDAASDSYISVDGAGAYEVIKQDKLSKQWTLTKSDQNVLTFDGNGDLKTSRDSNGNLITYTYAQGKLQSLQDDTGHTVTYTYSSGNLVQVTDETGAVLVRYEYVQNLLTAVVDRAGHRTTYQYYTNGQIRTITMPASGAEPARVLQFEYVADPTDSTGKTQLLQWLTDAEGNKTKFDYKFNVDNFSKYSGGTTTVLNALGLNRRESNAAEYVQWRTTNGFYATYDATRLTTDAAYKAQYDTITQRHTVTYGYNGFGAITSVVDQAGYKTTYAYDLKENLTAIIDANGYAIISSDAGYWRQLRAEYGFVDIAGQGKVVADLTAAEVAALNARYTTRMEYDARGNLTRKVDNLGNATTFTYTSFNKIASQTTAMGHALATSNEASVQDKRVELGYPRDAALLTQVQADALRALYTTTYTYNATQNVTEIRSPGGDLTRFEYDSFGNVTKRIAFLDATNLTDPAKQQVTQYYYDAFGQNVKTVDAEGNVMLKTFDHFGNVLSSTDGRGNVTRFSYDQDNRLLTVTTPEGSLTTYSYDSVGNRIGVRDANGHSVVYVYNRNNLLVTTIDPKDGDASGDRMTSASYDVVGNRTQAVDAEGRVTTYVYREDNRLLQVRAPAVQNAAGTGMASYATSYAYDGVGQRIAVTDFNGNRTDFVYSEGGLLKRTTDAAGNVTEYHYDANLNQIQVVIGAQLATERRRILRFSFDEEDQKIADTDALGGTVRYALDAVGNVVATTDANGHQTEYRFDRNNRLVTEIRPEALDGTTGLASRHIVTHQYDANGNQVATTDENGHTSRLTFDKDNRLVLVQDANGIQTVYAYDSRNNRTSIQVGVEATLDAAGKIVVSSVTNAQVQTFEHDEFNRIVSQTDGVGNALVGSDGALYAAMRQELGYAATVANLSAADKQALLAAYTDRYVYDKVDNLVTRTDHLGRVTRMAYDGMNRMTSRADALGQVALTRYDGNGNVVGRTDELARVTGASYDTVNRLVSETDALGVVTQTEYDNVGNLLARRQAAGTADERVTRYEYDLNNRLARSIDPAGAVQGYEYDPVGNRLRVVDGRGDATSYVYDARNRLVKTIDPLGFEVRTEYDGVGNKVTLVDARGGITRLVYDAGNRVIQSTDAEGRVSRLEYDVLGNRITQRTAVGTTDEQVTRFEYDAQNNLRAVVDGEGARTENGFDAAYNRTSVTDGNGHTTHYEFDAINRQVRAVDAAGQQTLVSYDALGNVLSQTDALGRVTHYAYDADNRVTIMTDADGTVTRYAYDAVDNRVTMTRAAGTAQEQVTAYSYDPDGRLLSETDALGHTTRHEYDANGNAVATVDALGQRTTYTYDADNRVVAIADALGQATQYRYDGNGNRVQVIDALGQASTTYYNLDNEVNLTVNAAGEATTFQYDANGNVTAQTRHAVRVPAGQDPALRPIIVSDAADQVTRYAYDHANRVVRQLDAEGALIDSRYDAVGNLMARTAYATEVSAAASQPLSAIAVSPGAMDRVTHYAYDAVNRRIESVDAEGYTTRFEYDAVGNRTARTLFLSKSDFANPGLQQRTVSEYDALNRLVAESSPIGVFTTYVYDALGNLTARTDAAGSADARNTRYGYDAANRRVSEEDALGTVTAFTYDAADRLVQQVRADGQPDARTTSYAYDAANRLVQTVHPDGSVQRSVYDAIGRVVDQVDAAGSASERHTTISYDRADRVVATVVGAGTPEALATTHAYDAFGNRVSSTVAEGTGAARVTRYAYDHLDRLIGQTDGNGIVTLNDYDAFGNRIATSITGQTQTALGTQVQRTWSMTFAYDGRNLVVGESDGAGNVIQREYDGAGNLRFERSGVGSSAAQNVEFTYDLANRLVRKTMDPSGLAITTLFAYDQRGNLVAQTDADGGVSRSRFDALDRAIVTTDAEGFSVSFTYDRFGNQVAITTGQYLASSVDAGYDPAKAARALPATTLLAYDAMDRKVLQADALGTVTGYGYDLRGNRIQVTEAAGHISAGAALTSANIGPLAGTAPRVSSYSYDSVDRLVDEVQPAGTLVHYAYNSAGEQVAKVVDYGQGPQFRNATTRFFYDAGGRLQFQADPVGTVTQTVYDGFGNVVRTIRGLALDASGQPSTATTADMRVTAYEYDAVNRRISEVVDPDGLALRTSYEYDVRGRQTAVTDGNGHRLEMAYDAADRMVWSRDGEGYVTAAEYDGRGLRTAETRYATGGSGLPIGALPVASGADRRSSMAYDATGRMTEAVDARGVVTRMAYDAIGNRIATIENATGLYGSAPRQTTQTFDAANLVTSRTEPSGLVTTYSYDGVYNLVQQRVENSWQGAVQVQTTSFAYDPNNRLTDEVLDPAGLRLHKAYRYDTLGNRVAETSANGFAAAETDAVDAFAARRALGLVDGSGRVLFAGELNAGQRQLVLDAFTKRTWFDAASRAVLTVDENGNAQSAQYDAVGNVVRSTQHADVLSLARRQALGDLTPAMLAPSGDDRTTDRALDKADRETVVRTAAARQALGQIFIDEYRAETRTNYDAVGNVVSMVDGNGNATYSYYDANNRLRGKLDAEGYLSVYTLDAFGNQVQERLTLERPQLSATQKASLDLDSYVLQGDVRVVTRAYDLGNHEVLTVFPASELVDGYGESAGNPQVVRSFDAFGQVASESVMHRAGLAAAATHYRYDAAGRLVAKVDAEADELLTADTPEVVGLRKQLGYVDASGGGKHAADLTQAERDAILAAYTSDYAYDTKGNVRQQVEAGRVTTFEVDVANRSTRVLYPAARRTEVDAAGNVTILDGYRAEGTRSYDANGNVIAETRRDGEHIEYRFDAGNRMVAALNDGVFVAYTYNFAGDLTRLHRYYNATGSVDVAPPAHGLQDQIVERVYDRLGRCVAEIQLGNPSDSSDDRVTRSGFDANGNQVQTTDARGYTATLVYDGLNRVTDIINREGGVTGTDYDALGNAIAHRTGGFDAPRLVGGVTEGQVSDRGLAIEWSTDRATDAQVLVRPAGSGAGWTVFGAPGAYTMDHIVRAEGLAADTVYEYRFQSKDAFGYAMESEIRSFRTSVGLPPVAVSGVVQGAAGWQAQLSFSLPPGAGAPVVRVGTDNGGLDDALEGPVFAPVLQADGSYSVSLAYTDADAAFQIEWTDATGLHRTGSSPIRQRVETRRLDATVKATAQGDLFTMTATWNLADVLADQGMAFATTPGGPSYSVYMGFTVTEGQSPNWTQATLQGGVFQAQFANLREGPRTLYLQYVKTDGGIVNATPIAVATLAGADLRLQNLELDFAGVDLTGTQMTVRTRKVGDTAWTNVPAATIKGTSVNLLGLADGQYEYEAVLTRNGQPLRNASGTLELREPASITGLTDTVDPQATVQYTLTDAALTLPSLADAALGPDESVTFELTDEQGNAVAAQFADGVLDVAALTPGSYSLVAKKIRTTTTTTTSGTPPVTTTQTTVSTLSQLEATLVVGPLALSNVEAQALSGTRTLTSYAPGASRTGAANVQVSGASSFDATWSFYDANGRKIFSNEEGGVWTRYFHDAAGNVTKEVRFQRRDGNGQFINEITNGDRPSLAQLQSDYEAAVSAHAAGADTARITLRSYDAANNKVVETELTNAHGAVTTRTAWDRFKNKLVETAAEGLAGLESTVRNTYDGVNRLVHTATGPFEHLDEAGNSVFSAAEESYGYDARGNQTLKTDSRGFNFRRFYDGYGRLATEWDGERGDRASTLRTEYGYDGFDRVLERRAIDLSGRAAQGVQVTTYEWSAFDQQTRATDALGHSTARAYDLNGNLAAETDANGATTYYGWDAENRVTTRIDRVGSVWTTAYDAYGQRLSEVDGNGRVTTYTMGAFGQILGTQTFFTRGYGALAGAGTSSDAMRYDWIGRLMQSQDSFGKNQVYTYNDADEQVRIDDYALGKAVGYGYDALGRRTSEHLDRGGLTQRQQEYTYNSQGWLTGVTADAGYNAGGGAQLSQQLNVAYRFDAAGNRVQVVSDGTVGQYAYDASGRMVLAVDDKGASSDTIAEVQYDGYGNRVLENRNGTGTAYTYDGANRVVASTAGEAWSYDANGNALAQHNRDGSSSTAQYNGENRATVTRSVGTDGKATVSVNTYDAVGNVLNTRVDGDGFGFDEVTRRDVRYLEMSKVITNSYANGAKGLEGATSFQYDANSNLTMLDRGRKQSGGNSVSFFDYDVEGHIIGKSDKATALTAADFFETYDNDPNTSGGYDEYGSGATTIMGTMLSAFGGRNSTTHLQSYIYANNKPIAEASGDLQIAYKTLTLTGGIPVYDDTPTSDSSEPQLLGWEIAVRASDLRYAPDGTLDRLATARAMAAHAYDGWTTLGEAAQNKVAAYVEQQMPDTVAANTGVWVKPYIVLSDSQLVNSVQITDYSYREIGAANPGGTVQNHVVRAGDTLQSIAAMYFGSPAYWYLIADANGLTGSESLSAGTVLKIPDAVANSVNNAETFKAYNESEIIGSTSPEIRTIKKKKKWYQKLIQIVIVVIMIVAALTVPMMAPMLSTSLAGAMAFGAAVMATASVITQGLAMAAGLQDKFSWKQVGKAAVGGAFAGAAAFVGESFGAANGAASGAAQAGQAVAGAGEAAQAAQTSKSFFDAINAWEVAARVGVEATRQSVMDGKISSVAGLVGAAMPGLAPGFKEAGGAVGGWIANNSRVVGVGLGMIENKLKGRGDNALNWVNLATSALFDNEAVHPQITTDQGKVNWELVAVQAVGAAIVGQSRGESAALDYFGNALGSGIAERAYREKAFGNALGSSIAEYSNSAPTQPGVQPGQLGSGTFAVPGIDDAFGSRLFGIVRPESLIVPPRDDTRVVKDWDEHGMQPAADDMDTLEYVQRNGGFVAGKGLGYRAPWTPTAGAGRGFVNPAGPVGEAGQAFLDNVNEVLRETRGMGPSRASMYRDLAVSGKFGEMDSASQRGVLAAMVGYADSINQNLLAGSLDERTADAAVRYAADAAKASGAILADSRFASDARVGALAGISVLNMPIRRQYEVPNAPVAGETEATALGKSYHSQRAAERRASGEFDMVNQPFVGADGRPILVTKRVDLRTGEPIPESGFQVARPDSVVFRRDLGAVIDDKPIGRPLAKDQQEILRFIRAYETQFGAPPKTIAIERYDPITMRPVVTELYRPGDFPLKKK